MEEGEFGLCFAVGSTSKASSGEGRNLAKFEVENVEAFSMLFRSEKHVCCFIGQLKVLVLDAKDRGSVGFDNHESCPKTA